VEEFVDEKAEEVPVEGEAVALSRLEIRVLEEHLGGEVGD
jgi:hypothetical protein